MNICQDLHTDPILAASGVEFDKNENLARALQQALTLAQKPTTPLPVRVTVFSIADDGGGQEVKRLAEEMVGNPETALILKTVAERVVKNS